MPRSGCQESVAPTHPAARDTLPVPMLGATSQIAPTDRTALRRREFVGERSDLAAKTGVR